MVGEPLNRWLAGMSLELLSYAPVQHHPACCPQLGLDRLPDHVVGKLIGVRVHFLQQAALAGRRGVGA